VNTAGATGASQELAEKARSVKSPEEIDLMRWTIRVAESGMWRIHAASQPDVTENEIWAELHHENIRSGGEWFEARLLSSGPRTNPWYQEASDRVTAAGDMISFDTDMIGPYGYCADLGALLDQRPCRDEFKTTRTLQNRARAGRTQFVDLESRDDVARIQ